MNVFVEEISAFTPDTANRIPIVAVLAAATTPCTAPTAASNAICPALIFSPFIAALITQDAAPIIPPAIAPPAMAQQDPPSSVLFTGSLSQ
jgi:hypothetical protein